VPVLVTVPAPGLAVAEVTRGYLEYLKEIPPLRVVVGSMSPRQDPRLHYSPRSG